MNRAGHAPRPVDQLTEVELEALISAAKGETCNEAGGRLYKGYETIRTHRNAAILKLNARNITHAVAIAIRRGILDPQEVLQ